MRTQPQSRYLELCYLAVGGFKDKGGSLDDGESLYPRMTFTKPQEHCRVVNWAGDHWRGLAREGITSHVLGVHKDCSQTVAGRSGQKQPQVRQQYPQTLVEVKHGYLCCAFLSSQDSGCWGRGIISLRLAYIVKLYPKHIQACCIWPTQSYRPALRWAGTIYLSDTNTCLRSILSLLHIDAQSCT